LGIVVLREPSNYASRIYNMYLNKLPFLIVDLCLNVVFA